MKAVALTLLSITMLTAPVARAEASPISKQAIVAAVKRPGVIRAVKAAATGLAVGATDLALRLGTRTALATGGGAAVGVYVTDKLVKSKGFWGTRLFGTRFRMANLPVGGAVMF